MEQKKSQAPCQARGDVVGMASTEGISVAIAQKIGAVETAADFLKNRTGKARADDLLPFLKNARNERPPVGDER